METELRYKTGKPTLERILEAGKDEFRKSGFMEASLRNIVRAAGVTTGAFYGYFPDKEALFTAVVEPAAGNLSETFLKAQRSFSQLSADLKAATAFSYSRKELSSFIDSIYSDFDAFKLVICCSAGTSYEEFIHSLVSIEVEYTIRFIRDLNRQGLARIDPDPNLMHILSSAYFHAVFETVVHDMTREEAEKYIGKLSEFFSSGWRKLWGL